MVNEYIIDEYYPDQDMMDKKRNVKMRKTTNKDYEEKIQRRRVSKKKNKLKN